MKPAAKGGQFLVDYSQYWFKNGGKAGEMTWPLQYKYSDVYSGDLSPQSWKTFITHMKTNSTAFDAFVQRRGLVKCAFGSKCHANMICNYLHGGEQITGEFLNCLFNF